MEGSVQSASSNTEQPAAPTRKRWQRRRSAYLSLLGNAAFGGITAVGLPVSLNAAGLSKVEIAVFFVVNGVIAVLYNTMLVPRIRRKGYPQWALLGTTAAVPVGITIIHFNASTPALLYLGGALMIFVSATVPQIMGKVEAQSRGEAQERVVADLRQILIVGYIIGLVFYSLVEALQVPPLLAAAGAALIAFLGAWGRIFNGRVEMASPRPPRSRLAVRRSLVLMIAALAVVGLMKSVDTLRGIYLPLFAVSSGVDAAAISPLFLVASLLELAALPLLARMSMRHGSPMTMSVVCGVGIVAFTLLLISQTYPVLLASQVLYAVVGAGFQSIGLVLLARAAGSDAGSGASAYMAVTQVGTVLGALLPLMVHGYSADIFLIAVLLCGVGMVIALALHGPLSRKALDGAE